MLTTAWGNVRYPSCRDKGRMWGREGALCLSWWQRDPSGTAWSKQVAPQPGQAQGLLIHSTPPLVPTGPWAASTSMEMIPRFGRQHSVGLDLSAAEELSSSFEPCLRTVKCWLNFAQGISCKPHEDVTMLYSDLR